MRQLRMVDLCSGTKSASWAMRELDWQVISIDIDPDFEPDIVADVRNFTYQGVLPIDLVWASPPCNEFALWEQPKQWHNRAIPDRTIWQACLRIIEEIQPKYYCIENVKGAQYWMGKATQIINPWYLWTNLPHLSFKPTYSDLKFNHRSPIKRALIPKGLSTNVAIVSGNQTCLDLECENKHFKLTV